MTRNPADFLALFVAGIAALAACSSDEAGPSSLVDDPRILAVRADPPVASMTDTVTLTPLIAGADEVPVELSWRACNPWQIISNPAVDCVADQSLALASADDTATVSIPEMIAAFPPPPWYEPTDAPPDASDDCEFDYGYVELAVVLEVTSPDGSRLVAIKRLRVTAPQAAPRRNPEIDAVVLDDDIAPVAFEPGVSYELRAQPRPDSLDSVCTSDGQITREAVRVYLYTDAGTLGDPYIDIEYTAEDVEVTEPSTWTAPDQNDPRDSARLWAVAIDSDGGVGWLVLDLTNSR